MNSENSNSGATGKIREVCPVEFRSTLEAELRKNGLRYMLAMFWQGRIDKIPIALIPMLDWITRNGVPVKVVNDWRSFRPGRPAFVGLDHTPLLNRAMKLAEDSLQL